MNVLLAFLGAVLLLISYVFVCGHLRDMEDAARAETAQLAPVLEQLQKHQLNITYYEQEIEASKETIAQMRKLHPDIVLPEELIQFVVELESQTDADVRSIAINEIEEISSFILPDDEGNPVHNKAYREPFSFTAVLGYGEFKNMLEEIYNADTRTILDNCSVAYNSEYGLLNATVNASQIFINNGSYNYQSGTIPSGSIGTTNPFNTQS